MSMPHARHQGGCQIVASYQLIFEPVKGHSTSLRSVAVYPQRRVLSREDPQEGRAQGRGSGEGLARPINNHGRSCGRRAAVAAKDLLPLPDLGPALFEGGSIGVQTLVKYRVIL